MVDTYALFFKSLVFEFDQNNLPIMDYTQNDLRRLEELNEWFIKCDKRNQMNKYTVNKYLGFVNYMLDNQEMAINYFIKAIEVFPMEERKSSFNPNETYETLMAMYYLKNDTANYRNTLERKIVNEPSGIKLVRDYRNMAFYYFSIGQNEKAMEWAKKAKEIDPKDFETQRLLTHLYTLVNMYTLADYYLKNSEKLISGCNQIYEFLLQLAIYQLYFNDVSIAFENINKARESFYEFNPPNRPCELCDKLIENYIKITE
jgi:tetratricopeptide (TPR) repeat protein